MGILMKKFIIDTRLNDSSFLLAEWELSNLYLKNEANYPWFILVPRIENVQEIFELSDENQRFLIQEISLLSKKMHAYFKPNKINVATLGNVVSQLHIHVVARFNTDSLWPQGIWQNAFNSTPYKNQEVDKVITSFTNFLKSQ